MTLARLNFGPAANLGSLVHLRDPITKDLLYAGKEPVGINVLGIDSDAYTVAERANRDEVVDANRKGVEFSAAEADARATRMLVACTIGWKNVPAIWLYDADAFAPLKKMTDEERDAWFAKPEHVEPAPYSPEAAAKLYDNAGVSWIREQVDTAIADRTRFLPR